MNRGDEATAIKGSHDFSHGEELIFIGLDYDSNEVEAHVFMNRTGNTINWLLDGDFSWVN